MQTPTSETEMDSSHRNGFLPTVGGSGFALCVLFSMNLLNYIDRYSFYAVGTHVKSALGINDMRLGLLNSSFMIVYTIASPLVGWFGDRYSRKILLTLGVGLWSVATVGTAFSQTYHEMFFWRALLGVGEAAYGVIAPALLADLFIPERRGRAMGCYYLALPLGGALGYGIGGWVADSWHWRAAFWVVGLPGLLVALLGLMIHDPGRGASEGKTHGGRADRPTLRDYLALFRNRTFLWNTAGMAAVTFASGGYAAWGSTFYQEVRGMSAKQAGVWIGALTAVAGLVGIVLGTWSADFLLKFTRRAYLLMASLAVLIAMPFALYGILDPALTSSLGMLFVAMVLLASVLGPCNTVTANVVPANQRAAGYALSIFLIHLLGDVSSPTLIGSISYWAGDPRVANSAVGQMLKSMGAGPVGESNLVIGMLSVIPVMILGGIFFLLGSRHLPADQARAQQTALAGEREHPPIAGH